MDVIKIKRNKEAFYGSLGSVAVHLLLLIAVVLILRTGHAGGALSGGSGYYIDVSQLKSGASAIPSGADSYADEDEVPDLQKRTIADTKIKSTEKAELSSKDLASEAAGKEHKDAASSKANNSGSSSRSAAASGFRNIESTGFDSTSLGGFYQESTLHVRMKYPMGWVFIDQQRKKKLDGITFWASGSNFNPPPYIHVEVVEKYIFNPDQYRYKYNFEKFTGYYNEPVELENQVSQVIYLRTDDDEDYTIKLIMENKEAFRQFQPVFFAIVKSFKFGNSFF